MQKNKLIELRYSQENIQQKTQKIYTNILTNSPTINQPNFQSITIKDLEYLFHLYDTVFFSQFFTTDYSKQISFQLSKRMTRSAGKTLYHHTKNLSISLSLPLLFQSYHTISRTILINGIRCHNRLEATMRVFEHELVHAIEFIVFGSSSCASKRFKQIAKNLFGHTETTHQLITQREIAEKSYQLPLGSRVQFIYKNKTLQGIIYRITKRATVMVSDENGYYKDSQGKRYKKYYVPLEFLAKCE